MKRTIGNWLNKNIGGYIFPIYLYVPIHYVCAHVPLKIHTDSKNLFPLQNLDTILAFNNTKQIKTVITVSSYWSCLALALQYISHILIWWTMEGDNGGWIMMKISLNYEIKSVKNQQKACVVAF